jgi:hypothetical protein
VADEPLSPEVAVDPPLFEEQAAPTKCQGGEAGDCGAQESCMRRFHQDFWFNRHNDASKAA